jgi:transcriptional antiterminator Rof (Rho-off)
LTNSNIWLSQILKRWEDLFDEVDYQDIPLEFVERMVIHLHNGEKIDLHIKDLVRAHNLDYITLEEELDKKLSNIEDKISFVDWHLDSSKAASVISDATNKILGDI